MVNATVDNEPVSIMIDEGQSTTVPSNETWRVSIYLGLDNRTQMTIDSVGKFRGNRSESQANDSLKNVTLTGGQTVTETSNNSRACIFITGFVVNS